MKKNNHILMENKEVIFNEELKKFSTFKNKNDFDDYYSKVLPTSII
jgi:hypothetical protein